MNLISEALMRYAISHVCNEDLKQCIEILKSEKSEQFMDHIYQLPVQIRQIFVDAYI